MPEGAIVYKKAWHTKAFQGKLASFNLPWLYDNRKLAWYVPMIMGWDPLHANVLLPRSSANVPSFSLEVDLGADEGRPGRQRNQFTLEVKQTCKVRLEALKGYLEGKVGWDNTVLECMSK